MILKTIKSMLKLHAICHFDNMQGDVETSLGKISEDIRVN